jgi:signal transduction histidine kinase
MRRNNTSAEDGIELRSAASERFAEPDGVRGAAWNVAWLVLLVVWAVTFAIFQLVFRSADQDAVLQMAVSGFQISAASAAAWWAARRCRGVVRLASAWRWIAGGLGCTAAGYFVLIGYQVVTGSSPYPSMADVLYLSCYPLFLVGVLRFPMRQESGPERVRARLDAASIALCGSCFVWVLILAPTIAAGGPNLMTAIISCAYPVADLLMVFGVARLLVQGSAASCRLPLQLLAGGMLATVVGDVLWGWAAFHPGAIDDRFTRFIYLGCSMLFLVAALTQRCDAADLHQMGRDNVPASVDRPRQPAWIPYLAPAALFGLLLYAQTEASLLTRFGLTVVATAVLLLAIFRQFTVQQDLGRTLDLLTKKTTELGAAQAQLVETARQAGMAEIATNVLHNVGNVLNSVNVSAELVSQKVLGSKSNGLVKAVAMMNEHSDDLGDFLTLDERGRALPDYLDTLATTLAVERESVELELMRLTKGVAHIKEIVAAQQSLARVSGVVESVNVNDLMEDALRMAGVADHDQVSVIRDFPDVEVSLDRHRVLLVLLNLISNATNAMTGNESVPRQLSLRAEVTAGPGVRITVADNGEGIPPENLTRIFVHGFTTHAGGHGFGLHGSALAAKEMAGELTVHSEGVGAGAVFTLDVPLDRHLLLDRQLVTA